MIYPIIGTTIDRMTAITLAFIGQLIAVGITITITIIQVMPLLAQLVKEVLK